MAKNNMLLYGGLALGAWLLLSKKGLAGGAGKQPFQAPNGTVMVAPSDYVVFDIHGNVVSVNSSLLAAQQSASSWGGPGAVNTIKNGGPNNWTYVQQATVGSGGGGGSDPTGNGWDWNPADSPYFSDVVSGVAGFFGF